MALSFLRRRPAPTPRQDIDRRLRRDLGPIAALSDDYLVEGQEEPVRPSATAQIASGLQIVLIVVLAILSLAIFWIVGLLLNVF